MSIRSHSSLPLWCRFTFTVFGLAGLESPFSVQGQPILPTVSDKCVPSNGTDCHSQEGLLRFDENTSILTYLTPELLENQEWLDEVSRNLKAGNLVVIENAFKTELAEHLYEYLANDDLAWPLSVGSDTDGFHFHHHNLYPEMEGYSGVVQNVHDMFKHKDSKAFFASLSGRDCSGEEIAASASHYMRGDHSLPHTDYLGERTVAFVWHLTKDWDPSWGGALFWCPAHNHSPFIHASFNTLSLFSVSPDSTHFVTAVSKEAQGKRLAFNGWYQAGWRPTIDHPLEHMTKQQQLDFSANQVETIIDMDLSVVEDPDRHSKLVQLQKDLGHLELGSVDNPRVLYI